MGFPQAVELKPGNLPANMELTIPTILATCLLDLGHHTGVSAVPVVNVAATVTSAQLAIVLCL